MSAFALPAERTDIAHVLRELEQNAPRPTSKDIRDAMINAAQALEDWRSTAEDCVKMLEEAQALRAGMMASESQHDEVQRQIKRAMSDAAVRLRAKL